MEGQGTTGNVIAAVCNVFIPGLGQLVQGRFLAALFFGSIFWLSFWAGYILFFPWAVSAIFWLWSVIDSAKYRAAGN